MKRANIIDLVTGTLDPAFAVSPDGAIVAFNDSAAELTGLPREEALGRKCGEVLQGMDECGPVCSPQCTVHQAVLNRQPLKNFDLQIHTGKGRVWCNVSVLLVSTGRSSAPNALYVIRPIDVRKRLELAMRDFIVNETHLAPEQAMAIVASTRSPAQQTRLTKREIDVLRLLATSATTVEIAEKLRISRATLHNHVQHVFRKLDVRTRLEAVRRAERAGLL